MILSVDGVHFRYNACPVLTDIRFELPRGKILALLGVNGAGKSTLLRCLAGILRVKQGSVIIDGKDALAMNGNELARHFAYVPQYHSDAPLKVFDMVLLGRKPHMTWGPSQDDLRRVEQILDVMGLRALAMRRSNRLSGGEMQKVIMARALVQEPQVLLLDEPTSNLDLRNQLQVMDLMKQAVGMQGLSAVVSVHDINLAFRYADNFLMLKDKTVHTLASKQDITPEMIKDVYGVDVILERVRDYKIVIPVEAATQ